MRIELAELADAIHEASLEFSDGYRPVSEGDAIGIADILLNGVEDKSTGFLSNDSRTITLDLKTGQWVDCPEGGIMGDEGARCAASLLPGMTPEAVDAAYSAFMRED